MGYTAEELVNKLHKEEGIMISVRTLGYYAYDKKMFPNLTKGKKGFSEEEYEILKRIAFLKEKTSLTLDEIRECVVNEEKYQNQVDSVICDSVIRSKSYTVANGVTFSVANQQDAPSNYTSAYTSTEDVLYSCGGIPNTASASNTCAYSCTTSPFIDECDSAFNNTNTLNGTLQPTAAYLGTLSKAQDDGHTTVVRINQDVTITVSQNISRERLIEIINFINTK